MESAELIAEAFFKRIKIMIDHYSNAIAEFNDAISQRYEVHESGSVIVLQKYPRFAVRI